MTRRIDRRRFLLGSAAALGGLSAFGGTAPLLRLARADTERGKDRYWIFCYFSGGWDILLSLDPRDPTQFTADRMPDTRIYPGYELLAVPGNDGSLVEAGGLTFGPFIGDLRHHVDKLAVVRGMSMDTLTHEAGRRRFLTGKPPSGLLARGSSGATWLASLFGRDELVPNLSVGVESYNVDRPTFATGLRVDSVPDLVRALTLEPSAVGGLERRQIDALLRDAANCEVALGSPTWQAAEDSRLGVEALVEAGLESHFDFQANTEEMAALRQHYGIGATGAAALRTPEAQAAMAVTALVEGVSRTASIQVASGIDAHYDEWSTDHGPAQERGFNAVARMVEDLASREYKGTGSSWLDHTTIVGFSEFSRTALLNNNGGRDHSLTNACFALGAGIRGGQAIGRSSDVGMAPYGVDLRTGRPVAGGEVIKPEHIYRALLADAGVSGDPADLRVEPLWALLRDG